MSVDIELKSDFTYSQKASYNTEEIATIINDLVNLYLNSFHSRYKKCDELWAHMAECKHCANLRKSFKLTINLLDKAHDQLVQNMALSHLHDK